MTDATAWAGIITGLAGLMSAAVAGIAVLVTSRQARMALNAQANLLENQQGFELRRERENRLWEKRADLYVDLLSWLRAVLEALRDETSELSVPPLTEVLSDRVAAFASDEIIDGVGELQAEIWRVAPHRRESLARAGQPTTDPEFLAWLDSYQEARDKVILAHNSVWDQVRLELNPETSGRSASQRDARIPTHLI